jgi:hypothetical protein
VSFPLSQKETAPLSQKETAMTTDYRKVPLAKTLSVGCFLAALVPLGTVMADDDSRQITTGGDSSPYLIGHWSLDDSFSDFSGGSPIKTGNTEFIFLNPTGLNLVLEYAFSATNPRPTK